MAVDASDDPWANADVTYTAEANEFGDYVVDYTGAATTFGVESVTVPTVGEIPSGDYEVTYYKANGTDVTDESTGAISNGGAPAVAGDYVLKITYSGDQYEFSGTISQEFTIKVASYTDVTVYQVNDDPADLSDTTLTYTGEPIKIGIAADGKAIDEVTYYSADKSLTISTDGEIAADVKPGDYKVKAQIKGANEVFVNLTIEKFDLASATVVVNDVVWNSTNGTGTTIESIRNGQDVLAAKAIANMLGTSYNESTGEYSATELTSFQPAYDVTASGTPNRLNYKGEYGVKYPLEKDADGENAYATGDAVSTVKVVEATLDDSDFTYDGDPWDADTLGTFDTADPETGMFDKSLVKASDLDKNASIKVTVTKDGQEVTEWTAPGTYDVVAEVVPSAMYEQGGKVVSSFTVVNGTSFQTFAMVGGKVIGSATSVPYTGEAYVPSVEVRLLNSDNKVVRTLVQGTDFTVEMKNVEGEIVEGAVDVDSYSFTLKSDSYSLPSKEYQFSVAQAEIKAYRAQQTEFGQGADKKVGIAETGEAIVPVIEYTTEADPEESDWKVLPSDVYGLTYKAYDKDGSLGDDVAAADLKEAGKYQATVKLNNLATNFNGASADSEVDFNIIARVSFTDVPANAWYAEYVADAATLEYMDGVSEGIFAPEQPMTRAEFARVVANMAGVEPVTTVEYPTRFTDVPANAWFAQAVEWASRYGIVNGTSETTFDPYGTITREQIATMLYRYAGNNAQANLSVLDQFSDAGQISEYAKNAMAWAVEEGYMNGKGENNLDPQGTALRCEIAKLAVMVQPEKPEL